MVAAVLLALPAEGLEARIRNQLLALHAPLAQAGGGPERSAAAHLPQLPQRRCQHPAPRGRALGGDLRAGPLGVLEQRARIPPPWGIVHPAVAT
eukprot:9729875-Lingulodinium_polyedra.AAC.1